MRLASTMPAGLVQGEVAHRREVIEVGVAAAGVFQAGLGQPELVVLHLELDLVHPEFVDEPGGLCRGKPLGGQALGVNPGFGQPAELAKIRGMIGAVGHGSVLKLIVQI